MQAQTKRPAVAACKAITETCSLFATSVMAHALQAAPVGPKAAFRLSTLPVLAAALSLSISFCILAGLAQNLSVSSQSSALAMLLPLSYPSAKAV